MGLCKCPKRKVTNLFCFEHRVNVCEHCLVANHTKCIVQSYLQWLQDSDYNPNCRLCNIPLATRETTRLVCYDLFHWACLNERAAQLPQNTAPAGYQCPSCSGPIFPPANLAGPVASALREKLATVNWARAGLGLPLIDEVASPEPEPLNTSDFSDWSSFNASAPRKVYDTRDDDRAPGLHGDYDDDKYRRRPALGWLAQLLRSRAGSRKRPLTLLQRAGLLLLLGLLGFLALLVLMSRLGRAAADSDPNLDPLMNPHIRVGPS
ncbi:PREDICTED: zinc finger protein-like 1 isoform X2 [Hipposideros armiger]|uniref:Zinc finger protein-like 1 n=1 Tax=Hipposideros armiger TaxID=186990 RepID=A0A8B7RPL8_HIPAR|nr:PREDICTED: zinc finger protein-like 1 isoform X2 [Hipposideros armiger]